MGGSSKGGSARVFGYQMTLQMGICAYGEGLRLRRVRIGEKTAWKGDREVAGWFDIEKKNLFGGKEKEGGVWGVMHWLPGDPLQILPTGIARRMGYTSRYDAPAYRGLASLFFTGERGIGGKSTGWDDWCPTTKGGEENFEWCVNNPYIKSVWVRVLRPPRGLNPETALLPVFDDPDGVQAANPAHMIFECLTDRSWGAGNGLGSMDRASFEVVADKLYEEGFGLAAKWMRQSSVEDFINEILDHIHATLFIHPRTGLYTLKLLRQDYDIDDLRVLDPSNCTMSSFKRQMWGESTNEITVSWTNAKTEKTHSLTIHDAAAIAAAGGEPSASSRDYYMIRSHDLAAKVAERDIAMSSSPIATCDVEIDRTAWDLVPGEMVVLNWPEHSIAGVPFRVTSVDYGSPGNGRVRASLMEDIFGRDVSLSNLDAGDEGEAGSSGEIEPIPAANVVPMTAPALLTAAVLGVNDPSELEYPDSVNALLVQTQPDGVDMGLYAPDPITDDLAEINRINFAGHANLAAPIVQEATTELSALANLTGTSPQIGDFLVIGNGGETENELAYVYDITSESWLLRRGALDTVPRVWSIGTQVWVIRRDSTYYDPSTRAAGEQVTYRVLPKTTYDELALEDADDIVVDTTERAYLPLRPANVKVNGQAWGAVNVNGAASVDVTWSRRNRLDEALIPLGWDEADVSPESGQVTRIRIYDSGMNLMSTVNNQTGTSATISLTSLSGSNSGWLEISSVKDGEQSLQAHLVFLFNINGTAQGYGYNYGVHYGE